MQLWAEAREDLIGSLEDVIGKPPEKSELLKNRPRKTFYSVVNSEETPEMEELIDRKQMGFGLTEEEHNENYPLPGGLEMARRFKEINPYDHPLGIHNIAREEDSYVDSPFLDLTAVQTGQPGRASAVKFAVEHNQIAVDWIARCRERGNPCW